MCRHVRYFKFKITHCTVLYSLPQLLRQQSKWISIKWIRHVLKFRVCKCPLHCLPGRKARKAHHSWCFFSWRHCKQKLINKTTKLDAMAFPTCIRDFNAILCRNLKITGESHCNKFRGLAETWLIQRKLLYILTAKAICHLCPPP